MSEADTLIMIGTSFPYIEYLPKPGQARGIQIDIKAEKIGLRYPVEVGLTAIQKKYCLLCFLYFETEEQRHNSNSSYSSSHQQYRGEEEQQEFLRSKQQSMKEWIGVTGQTK